MRSKDSHILYIGKVKFVDDSRFELLPGSTGGAGDWTLKLKFVEASDAGDFECQLSTSPKLSKTFRINVVGK